MPTSDAQPALRLDGLTVAAGGRVLCNPVDLALVGPSGSGKTTFHEEGAERALGAPFAYWVAGGRVWDPFAARRSLREAVRRGMIPIINSLMVVGLVSLLGMMTGQILAGADSLQAVKYQVVIRFMIAAGTSLSCILMAMLVFRRLFNERHQLRSELIRRR